MARRVFLLGLDGGSWNVFDHLFAKGVMPRFQQLCQDGARAVLESTLPPITPVAWTSLMTGVNPGRHGVFAFRKPKPDNSYLPMPVNRMDMQVPTVFDYYRDDPGFVSLNLPMSFPATPLAGRMVTGMMTPQGETDLAAHPATLLEEFAAAGIDYVIDPKLEVDKSVDPANLFDGWKQAPEEFLATLGRITENRMKAVDWVRAQRDWSVFICVIVGTDRIQHLFWDTLMSDDAGPIAKAVEAYYRQVDRHIGDLMDSLDPEDALLVMSDHGFVKTHGSFQTNEWLRRHGWIAKREAKRSPLYPVKVLLNRLGITRAKLGRVLSEKQSSHLQLRASHIDWSKSQAYLSGPFAIRINLKGRETLGQVEPADFDDLVARIAAELRDLRDETGTRLISDVSLGSDIYRGDGDGNHGDIVFTFRDDLNHTAYAAELGGDIFDREISKQGDHRVDGILAAWGGGIQTCAEGLRLSIDAVLPTVMHLNGRPIPGVCDGRVATEILSDDHPVETDPDWQRFRSSGDEISYTADQENEINERLKALGYLSDD